MNHIRKYLQTHDFRPPNFIYPPLHPYLQTISLNLISAILKSAAAINFYPLGRSINLYLLSRSLVATLGALTAIPTYLLAKKIANRKLAMGACLIFGGLFINVVPSHYLKNEVPLTFFGAWVLLFSTRLLQNGKTKDYILSSIFSTFCLMTHYNGALFLAAPLLAHLSRVRSRQTSALSKNILLAGGAFLLSAFVVSPYHFLLFKETGRQIWQVYSNRATYPLCTSRADGIPTPIWYFLYLLTSGLFYPTFLAFVGGTYLVFKHRKKEFKYLLTFAGFYLLFFSLPPHRIDRYLTPPEPDLCNHRRPLAKPVESEGLPNFGAHLGNSPSLLPVTRLCPFDRPTRYSTYRGALGRQHHPPRGDG